MGGRREERRGADHPRERATERVGSAPSAHDQPPSRMVEERHIMVLSPRRSSPSPDGWESPPEIMEARSRFPVVGQVAQSARAHFSGGSSSNRVSCVPGGAAGAGGGVSGRGGAFPPWMTRRKPQ